MICQLVRSNNLSSPDILQILIICGLSVRAGDVIHMSCLVHYLPYYRMSSLTTRVMWPRPRPTQCAASCLSVVRCEPGPHTSHGPVSQSRCIFRSGHTPPHPHTARHSTRERKPTRALPRSCCCLGPVSQSSCISRPRWLVYRADTRGRPDSGYCRGPGEGRVSPV